MRSNNQSRMSASARNRCSRSRIGREQTQSLRRRLRSVRYAPIPVDQGMYPRKRRFVASVVAATVARAGNVVTVTAAAMEEED
jgi:hypothetical protein